MLVATAVTARMRVRIGGADAPADALRQQRMDMYTADLFRSIGLVVAAALVLFAASKQKLNEMVAVIILGVLLVGDLYFIDRNYVNADDFVSAFLTTELLRY